MTDSVFSDQLTIIDVLEDEFLVVPNVGDLIDIPATGNGIVAVGTFEVIDTKANGGGETTLSIRKVLVAKP